MSTPPLPLQLAKRALRQKIKERLATLSDAAEEQQSKVVSAKLVKNEVFQRSKRVSIYLSTNHEISTTEIIKTLLNDNKQCFVPKYRVGGAQMDMVPLYSWDDYEKLPLTKWNIKQPAADDIRPDALESGELDLIIAPGVAFTTKGDRLGHGRGYYDSYLKRCITHSNGKKPFYVGLALREQIEPEVPMNEGMDVPLDLVLFAD